MFSPIDSWKAVDEDGRSVTIRGRTGVSVTERERQYFVDSELATDPNRISLFVDEAFVIEHGQRVPLSSTETVRVCKIALQGLLSLGLQVDVLPASFRENYT